MTLSHEQIFQRYIHAGAMTRDPDAMAALFTDDGILEAPLVPAGHRLPQRLTGREAIRAGVGAFHEIGGDADVTRTGYVLHETTDPDVFIAETDATLTNGETYSLVQIFRIRDGRIARLRDYFRPPR